MGRTNDDVDDGGWAVLRLRRATERFRQSLFYLPALFVAASIALALTVVRVDRWTSTDDGPSVLSTTVDNARSILSTVAGGTIAAASIVFSITLVAVQLASSQFSPRVVRGFLRDRFQQVVMGVVVGTFSYCLLVLRVVQETGGDSDAEPFLPRLSVLGAVVLGIASLLAVLASIDHTAKSLRVGTILDRIASETIAVIEARHEPTGKTGDAVRPIHVDSPDSRPVNPARRSADVTPGVPTPPETALVVRSRRTGWVAQISTDALLDAAPEGSTLLLHAAAGAYLVPGERIAAVWPAPDDAEARDVIAASVDRALDVSDARTLQQDVAFGLLQLTDIAMRALSPGINDPNTAIEALHRIGRVLTELISAEAHRTQVTHAARTVVRSAAPDDAAYLEAGFGPVRRHGRSQVDVLEAIVRTLVSVRDIVEHRRAVPPDLSGFDVQLDRVEACLDDLEHAEERERLRRAIRAARPLP